MIWTAVFAIAIVPVYGWLVARVSRAMLVPAIYGFVAVAFVPPRMVFDARSARTWWWRASSTSASAS